ncbi:MAG: AMP-binding protein [Stagnimonas sp.]|nr:AMP-binding protein [Stagnimonas sp.]
MTEELFTPGRRLSQLAAQRPDEIALVVERSEGAPQVLTRLQLEQWANRLAHRLARAGVGPQAMVAIHLPNCAEHVVATLAAFKLGACPMPVSTRMPPAERDALLALGQPAAILSDDPQLAGISRAEMQALGDCPDTPPPDAVPQPFKAIASGGSTGKPKLIVSPGAFQYPAMGHPFVGVLGLQDGDRLYSPGPLYHNQAFLFTQVALFSGGSAVLNERFDAERCFDIIERWRPTVLSMVPTMLLRMLRTAAPERRDLSSVRTLWHLAAPCADWVKRGWIALLGAERVNELWAATEITGITTINGSDWLQKPGSVGRGWNTEILVLDADRKPLPVGEVGELFTRFAGAPAPYRYLGAAPAETYGEGYTSVGDLGHVDADGYLFLADRRVDLIISGGANVVPAEVEAVLTQHPAVRDAAVIGLKDEDLGRRVHALIELRDGEPRPSAAELDRHARSQLASYKLPKDYEFVAQLPRDEAGKIRRSALRQERGG